MEHAAVPVRQIEPLAGGRLGVLAPAKINLNLLVGLRREDGYHPLDSIVAKVTLFDQIVLHTAPAGEIRLACSGQDAGPDEQNLALLAAGALADEMRRQGQDVPGAAIELHKRIPAGKGLGGGSSDAAAVLRGLDALWGLGLAAGELSALAASLGSDVPLFLGPATLRMTGRGEIVEPLEVADFAALLHLPACACPTASVYRAFDDDPPTMRPQVDPAAFRRPGVEAWEPMLVNQLADAARRAVGELEEAWRAFEAATGREAHLTGSGSCLFQLYNDAATAWAVRERMAEPLRAATVVVRRNAW